MMAKTRRKLAAHLLPARPLCTVEAEGAGPNDRVELEEGAESEREGESRRGGGV